MWWQIQSMEISIGQLLGNVSMTLYADWDTQLPSNLEDSDLSPEAQILRPGRRGLTSISHCLWRYEILYFQRAMRVSDGSRKNMPLSYMMSPSVSLAEKDAKLDEVEKALGEKFIQHCEPLNPLHVLIQIGVRSFVLAARRGARQPALVNAKISEMPQRERDDLLKICTTCLDYYVLSVTTESLRGFRWHSENYFQWAACKDQCVATANKHERRLTDKLQLHMSSLKRITASKTTLFPMTCGSSSARYTLFIPTSRQLSTVLTLLLSRILR